MAWSQVARDPFARQTLLREVVKTKETCDWCGNNRHGRLFEYAVMEDSGKISDIDGAFCSISCMRAYHE